MVAVAGCSKNDPKTSTTTDDYEASTVEIGFSADESTTRADIKESFESGDSFGVHAYYVPDDGTITSSTTAYISNLSVGYNGSDWTYSPAKYWPLSGTLSFFAYYPYVEAVETDDTTDENIEDGSVAAAAALYTSTEESELSGTSISLYKNSGEYPKISYTPHQDVSQQVDFMTATSYDKYYSNSDDGVSFNFAHQLTRIKFAAAHNCGSGATVKITSITLNGKANAVGTFDENGNFSWDSYNESADDISFTITSEAGQLNSEAIDDYSTTSEYKDLMAYTGTSGVMMIPKNMIGSNPQVNITYSYQGANTSEYVITEKVTFNNSTGLTAGSTAVFSFIIYVDEESLAHITTGTVSMTTWEEHFDEENNDFYL